MVTKKEVDATGIQVGSKVEIKFKLKDFRDHPDRFYVIAATERYLGVTDSIQTVRAAISSQRCAYSYLDYSKIKSFKVLKKELCPVTEKEFLDFGVKKGDRLEVIVADLANFKSRVMGYVARLDKNYLRFANVWDNEANKPSNLFSSVAVPYSKIKYYIRLGTDSIE